MLNPAILKIFKGVWFFSILATVALFLYGYAGLRADDVILREGAPGINRDLLFYLMLSFLAILNGAGVLLIQLRKTREPDFGLWLYGLLILVNAFATVAFQFVSLINSNEKFNYNNIGSIIFGSVTLVVLWSAALPVYRIIGKLSGKRPI